MTVLMPIGGNMKLDGAIMEAFIQKSGGKDARIVVIPTASSRVNGGSEYVQAMQLLQPGVGVVNLPIRGRADGSDGKLVSEIRQASGIFMAGGDQLRLSTVLAGTPLLEAIRGAFEGGAVVAGTSAGAAVMGRVMITGGPGGSAARAGLAQIAEGFNFERRIIFDQHFHQRNRLGRLMFAITLHPHLLGIGIDEDTAAVISGDELEVIGRATVTVLDGLEMMESNVDQTVRGEWLSFSHVKIHQLTPGCKFDLEKRTAFIFRKALDTE